MTTAAQVLSWKIVQSIILCSILLIVPALSHNQYLTGTVVNATLLLATLYLGPTTAIMMGFVPSLIALTSGLLPIALAPVIPFIMVSNSLYIISFHVLRKQKLPAIAFASIAKFVFLSLITYVYFSHALPAKILPAVQAMMSYPQLITAVLGGLFALAIARKYVK